MTDVAVDPSQFEAEIDGEDKRVSLTVRSEPNDEYADYSSSPWVEVEIKVQRDELTFNAVESFNEEQTVKLIAALGEALERSRALARERGYYDWVAEGRPEYDA